MKRWAPSGRKTLFVAAAAALLAAPAVPAGAQEGADWSGRLTLYAWAAGLGGSVTPFAGAPTLEIDKSFSDVLESLDAAFFLTGYAVHDRTVLLGDLSYSALSNEGVIGPGLPASGSQRQTSLTLAAGYRVMEDTGLTVDLLGGLRLWDISGRVNAPPVVSASPSLSFADPIVAVRANAALSDRWTAFAYADVGGFGIGSDLTTQVAVAANWRATDNVFLSVGYRVLNLDYNRGGTRIDTTMQGPLVGVTWQF